VNHSRRRFLKSALFLGGALCVKPQSVFSQEKKISKGDVASVLVDLTRCIGCRSCSRACLNANRLPVTEQDNLLLTQSVETPTFQKWSTVNLQPQNGAGAESEKRPVKRQCMHCLEPTCVSVCPVGALNQTEAGPVIYRTDRCIGCRYCMIACPFDVPKFEWNNGLTPVIGKCQFCFRERLLKGQLPGCVESCPTGALKFGKRKDLLFEAHARIRANPKKYVASIYGENEVGGTSWLYLSDLPFEKLGFKSNLTADPIPSFTWEVVSRLPMVVAALASLFGVVATTLPKKEKV